MSATLVSLRIRNLALVEDLLWEIPTGCVAITGETGAGKSIILGAVKLLVGERGEKSLIRSGAESCSVEGVFDLPPDSPVHAILEEGGAEPCEDGRLLIRRTLTLSTAGRQFANGSPCTLALLRQVGDLLVDLHGPHDHQSLFSRDQQLFVLDAFAGCDKLRLDFAIARREYLHLTTEKARLSEEGGAIAREVDLLTHQIAEIESASLLPDEEDPLLVRHKAAANNHRIVELCANLSALLEGEDSPLVDHIAAGSRLAREMQRLDSQASPIAEAIGALHESTTEISRSLEHYSASLESDPAVLAGIESRLDLLQTIKRKYGITINDAIAFGVTAAERLAALRNREVRTADLDHAIPAAEKTLRAIGEGLTRSRTAAVPTLSKLVKSHLADLGFVHAGFSIGLESLSDCSPQGFEHVEFLFAPNVGEPERPLRAIASSGEISRVMLALKSSLAAKDSVPILIFDEIDANVGGEIGAKVGAKMKELGTSHQVLCITHLPQVAAAASSQFVVTKEATGERTRTDLIRASGDAREQEIARMLGGQSSTARKHAHTLLAG